MEATSDTVSQAEATVTLGVETLRGDIRDRILDDIAREMPCWTKLSESEQKKFIRRADELAYKAVNEAVKIAAHHGFDHLSVTTGKWTVKEGLKLEVSGPGRVEDITALAVHGARGAVLVLAEPSVFYGQRADALADKDQPEMSFEGEGAEGDEDGEEEPEGDGSEAATAEGAEAGEPDRSPLPEPPTSGSRTRRRAPAVADA